MRLQPMLLALPLFVAGCACSGASTHTDAETYVVIESVEEVAPAPDAHAGSGGSWGTAAGGAATADYSNPCAPCAPISRTVYHDAGSVYVDHVHSYREIHRHSLEVSREDQGCADCPPGVNPGAYSK